MPVSDDAFEAFAKKQEEEQAAQANRSTTSGNRTYTEIKWCGLESKIPKIVRAVGGPPDSKLDEFTARTCRIASIVGDNGKKFRCVLPERSDDPDHLLWRIIARVKAAEWIDGKKSFPIQEKHPSIFNIVASNGFTPTDKQFIFEKGWEGRQVLIMNVIDRSQMGWHKENKHSMLLSRSIGKSADGNIEYPEEGVPSYGFSSLLANLFRYYKSWEKYDLGITRTGQKESPYRIINASKYLEEVPEDLKKFVVEGPLSEEEASWERYDLSKLFGITYYTKIKNRLGVTIARIDSTLGTHYSKELDDYVEKEKKLFQETGTPDEPAVAPAKTEVQQEVATPVVTRSAVRSTPSAGFDTALLKGWDKLVQTEKDSVEGITVKQGALTDVQYKNKEATLLACPSCTIPSPDTFLTCPSCGISFA